MADIEGLKQRIELIDLRLKTAHSARERESAALMEMWEQIRERFQQQNSEIVDLRSRIVALEDTRTDLQNMVNSLLGSVESGLERMSDETVPKIREMAMGLLDKEEVASAGRSWQMHDKPTGGEAFGLDDEESEENDFLTELERTMTDSESYGRGELVRNDEALSEPSTVVGPPVSAGIRDLIARIGNSIIQPAPHTIAEVAEDQDQPAPEGLTQDLLEIEHLRNELLGLRARISHNGG